MKIKRCLELRLAAERLAAAGNRSLGLGTADQPAQLAYIAALEDAARAAPVSSPPSACVSAAEKAAVLADPYQHLRDAMKSGKVIQTKFRDDYYSEWEDIQNARFDSPAELDYRIKPEGA